MELEYRSIGNTSIKASLLGLGCRGFGRRAMTPKAARLVVQKALELGINFFDTADIYGDGQSESFLAFALEGVGRDSYILATKGGSERIGPGTERQNGDPHFLRQALERSLRRLNTDYIDLYQLHNPDPAVPFEDTADTLIRFRDEGKVRAIGVSNMSASEMKDWIAEVPDTASVQLPYSLIDRSKVESTFDALPEIRGKLSLIPWGPLFAGLLIDPPPIEKDKRTGLGAMFEDQFVRRALDAVAVIRDIASEHGAEPADVALGFVLRRPEVATVPVGATSPNHVIDNTNALTLNLGVFEMARLQEVADAVPEPRILMSYEVVDTLSRNTVAVLPFGLKVKVPFSVKRGDKITINLWDGRYMESKGVGANGLE